MLSEDTNAIIEGRGRAIDALINERASLQTALAAATKDAEDWRKDVSRWKQNFSEVNEQLAAANASIETWREALAKCEADRSATKDELAAANAKADKAETNHTENEKVMAGVIAKWSRDWLDEHVWHEKAIEALLLSEEATKQLQAQRERAEAAERSRDLTERVLVDTTEKLLAAEADRDETVGLLRRVWPEIVMGNNETVDNWQEEATTFLVRLRSATDTTTYTPSATEGS